MGREAADEVVDLLGGTVPVDAAGVFEYLRRGAQGGVGRHLFLGDRGDAAGQDVVDGVCHQLSAQQHEAVVHGAHVVGVGNGDAHLADDFAGVNLLAEKEGGEPGLGLAVDDGPVDGRRAAVLGQEGGVKVERAQAGHGPDDLGEHAKGYDYLQIGLPGAQGFQKVFVLQLLGLEQGQAVLLGVLLDGRGLQPVAAPGGLVGHGDDTHHVVTAFDEAAQGLDGKLRRAHVDDSQVFFLHHISVFFLGLVSDCFFDRGAPTLYGGGAPTLYGGGTPTLYGGGAPTLYVGGATKLYVGGTTKLYVGVSPIYSSEKCTNTSR